jgi:hypothetical protein
MGRPVAEALMRPPGDPAVLGAAARRLAAAADELERLGRQAAAIARDLVAGGAWDGPASREYQARDGALGTDLRVAASALRVAGEALAGLSSALADAQATWDRASALAASSGLALGVAAHAGSIARALPPADPRAAAALRVSDLLHEAERQADAADRAAMARLAEAARIAAQVDRGRSPVSGPGAAPGWAARGAGAPAGEPERHAEGGGSLVGWVLDLADRVGVALSGGFAAIEARSQALLRLVRSGEEPAAALGAVRALAAFERSAFTPTMTALLPVLGPPLTLAANLAEREHGDGPILRAVVRSLGESLGADVGQRLGMAACGVDAGATAGTGAVLCPAVTIAATSAGAALGGAAAVRIYDALGPDPPPDPELHAPREPDAPYEPHAPPEPQHVHEGGSR